MNLKPSIFAVFATCLFGICTLTVNAQKIIKVDTLHADTLRIDPSNSMGGNVTDFFTEIEYVPLETTNESLFGSIRTLEMTDDRYLILDSENKYVLIFDKKGKFIKKVGFGGKMIGQFTMNKWTKQFILSDQDSKSFFYYDMDGKPVKTIATDNQTNKHKTPMTYRFLTADKGFAEYHNYMQTDTTSEWYKTFQGSLITYADEDRTVKAKGLQFPKAQIGLDRSYMGRCEFITPGLTDSIYYYSRLYDYSIYTVTPNSIKLSYKFIFPLTTSLPNGFVNDTTMRSKRWEWFRSNPDIIQNVGNFYRTGNNIFFTAQGNNFNDEDMMIFNLKSGTLVGYKHIEVDQSNYFLSIFERRTAYSSGGILTAKDGCLYTSMSSLEMFDCYQRNKDRKIQYPEHLNTYFTKRDRKDNPVIVRLKLKDNI